MNEDLWPAFGEEFALLADLPPIKITLTRVQTWALLAQLQLALRHPQNTGPTAHIAARIARTLEKHVTPTPALAEIARRGWDPSFDEGPEPNPPKEAQA